MAISTYAEPTSIFGGILFLVPPASYRVMSTQEISATCTKDHNDEWAIRNEDLHVIISLGKKKIPLLARGTALTRVIQNTEKTLAKQVGSFKKLQTTQHTVDGQEALGIRFDYTAQDIAMSAEYVLAKTDRLYISFVYMARTSGYADNYHTFEEMLSTVALV